MCIYIYICVCVCVCKYVCKCVCAYVYVNVYVYVEHRFMVSTYYSKSMVIVMVYSKVENRGVVMIRGYIITITAIHEFKRGLSQVCLFVEFHSVQYTKYIRYF